MTSTKKTVTSAVNILQSFSENSSVPYYRLAIFGFMVIIGLCLTGTVVVVKYPSLEWDNSKVTANPILEFSSLNDVLFAGLRS